MKISHDRLLEILEYDFKTGYFRWKVTYGTRGPGQFAGYKRLNGSIRIVIDQHQYGAHNLAWFYVYGEWPKGSAKHLNKIKWDNRIENLYDTGA